MLGPEVVVRDAELVDAGFDARRTRDVARVPVHDPQPAGARPVPRPLRVVDRRPLDLALLRLAADPFVGEHDFAAFCRKGPRRIVDDAARSSRRWVDEGDGVLRYEIRANAFCWQMVRSIVGTLVEVGDRASAGPAR